VCWVNECIVLLYANSTMATSLTINTTPKLDWLVLFAHLSRGGKLITISLSHLKIQKITSRTWMQTKAH
jgi:hypothetical protein